SSVGRPGVVVLHADLAEPATCIASALFKGGVSATAMLAEVGPIDCTPRRPGLRLGAARSGDRAERRRDRDHDHSSHREISRLGDKAPGLGAPLAPRFPPGMWSFFRT